MSVKKSALVFHVIGLGLILDRFKPAEATEVMVMHVTKSGYVEPATFMDVQSNIANIAISGNMMTSGGESR